MDYRIRLNLAGTAAIAAAGIGLSLFGSSLVAARAYESRSAAAARNDQTIQVKGSTRKRIRSDRAVWQIRVGGESAELKQAFERVEQGAVRVREYLKECGFGDAEIGLSAIDTATHYQRDAKGNETREIDSYRLSREYTIAATDVDRVARAAGDVTRLIQEGVLVISRAPQYYYTDLPALRVELLGSAARDARARADEIAANAGCRVAEVRAAQMGVLQVTQPFSTDVSDYGMYDTSSIDKDVQAVVTVTFRIDSQ